MSRVTKRLNIILAVAAVALVATLAAAGCAPQQAATTATDEGAAAQASTTEASGEPGAYVSDGQCLSCHGGSYEALAERTADLGDWNPHDSLHGGYNACVNCHAKDKELTFNYCENCHVYAPDEEPLY